MKANPLCEPVPTIFFGNRIAFISPNVLREKKKSNTLLNSQDSNSNFYVYFPERFEGHLAHYGGFR